MTLKSYSEDRCHHCALNKRCFSETTDSNAYKSKVSRHNTLDKDQHYYRRDDACGQVAVVQSGAFKLTQPVPNQADQIIELVLPGDYIGLDALYEAHHQSNAVALQRSRICVVPAHELTETDTAKLLKRSMQQVSWHRLLPRYSAPARVAQLLVRMSESQAQRGLHAQKFSLPMTRTNLSNYLMLALETVSRTLTSFAGQGWIEIQGKEIVIVDEEELRQVAADLPLELRATAQA